VEVRAGEEALRLVMRRESLSLSSSSLLASKMPHPRDAGYAPVPPSPAATDADLEGVSSTPSSFDPFLSSAISIASREPVFPLIHRIKKEVIDLVDAPLTWSEFKSPTFNFSVVRPLVLKLSKGDRPAISLIFAILVCRTYFVERSDDDLAFACVFPLFFLVFFLLDAFESAVPTRSLLHSSVNTSRADLCELLAIKLLSAYGTAPGSFELLHVLTATFNPFTGATVGSFAGEEGVDEETLQGLEVFGKDLASNALELGIFSKAKRFVKTPLGSFCFPRVLPVLHTDTHPLNSPASHQSHL
jgi:hypothetical protein